MNLIKQCWTQKDIAPFQEFLQSKGKGESKAQWEKNLLQTQLPCIAVPSKIVNEIVKEIYKGNYLSFIDLWIWNTWTNTAIIGKIINKIKDFETQKKYLDIFANKIDCWGSSDCLHFKTKNREQSYFELANAYLKSEKTFVRRVGVIILFDLIKPEYCNRIFKILNDLNRETEYYVNMASAWLLCECFIKCREETLAYLKNNTTNSFIINNAIQKCRDSHRVTAQDKEMLLSFKIK